MKTTRKRILILALAAMMALCCFANAESGIGIIGGSDGPTSMFVTGIRFEAKNLAGFLGNAAGAFLSSVTASEPETKGVEQPEPIPQPEPAPQPEAPRAPQQTSLFGAAVTDIRQAVSIGDRFLFQRELFGGNAEKLQQTLTELNALHSFDEAVAFIERFGWDRQSPTYELFTNVLRRRFQ